MSLSLHTISSKPNSRKGKKRVGRGLGSKGTYSGRGIKGQRARSGGRSGLKLKGMRSIILATPKLRGFKSLSEKPEIVKLGDIAKKFADGSKVNPKILAAKKMITSEKVVVKILGTGTINIKVIVSGCNVSTSAKEKIISAGGSIV